MLAKKHMLANYRQKKARTNRARCWRNLAAFHLPGGFWL